MRCIAFIDFHLLCREYSLRFIVIGNVCALLNFCYSTSNQTYACLKMWKCECCIGCHKAEVLWMFLVCIYAVASDLCGYLLVYLAKHLYFSIVNSIEMYEGWFTQTLSVDQACRICMVNFRHVKLPICVNSCWNDWISPSWSHLYCYKQYSRFLMKPSVFI